MSSPDSSPRRDPYEQGMCSLEALVGARVAGCIGLDGESLLLPSGEDFDDVSSINSSIHRPTVTTNPIQPPPGVQMTQSNETAGNNSKRTHQTTSTTDHREDDLNGSNTPKRRTYCVPTWVRRAPFWLKVVFLLSATLLIGAVVLVVVGMTLAFASEDDIAAASNNDNDNFADRTFPQSFTTKEPQTTDPTFQTTLPPTTLVPTLPPIPEPTPPPVEATDAPTNGPVVPTTLPTLSPVATPSSQPTQQPSLTPSTAPTEEIDEDIIVFYAIGGRFSDKIEDDLPRLPKRGGTSFLMHMGDWNNPTLGCPETAYQETHDRYSQSSIPVYFLMGDNEYNDCENPLEALRFWESNLLSFETKHWGETPWDVSRLAGQLENFVFSYERAVFASINLVDGDMINEDEQNERLDANLDWIGRVYREHRRRHSILFLFVHSAPDATANEDFYDSLLRRIEDEYTQLHFVLVHRNGPAQDYGMQREYRDISNLDVISVLGPVWPPLQITVDTRADPEEAVSLSFEEWYEDLQ